MSSTQNFFPPRKVAGFLFAFLVNRFRYLECESLPGERLPGLDGDVDLLVDEPLRVARALRLTQQVVHPRTGALHVRSANLHLVRIGPAHDKISSAQWYLETAFT